jgi:hypothetical protein
VYGRVLLNFIPKNSFFASGLYLAGLWLNTVAGFFERGDGSLCFIKGKEFLDLHDKYFDLKKESFSCCSLF